MEGNKTYEQYYKFPKIDWFGFSRREYLPVFIQHMCTLTYLVYKHQPINQASTNQPIGINQLVTFHYYIPASSPSSPQFTLPH